MSARILVIEGNPTNLQLTVYLLKAYGHMVLTAVDGKDQGISLALGATKFIVRPIKPLALVAEIEDCLQKRPPKSVQ